MKLCLIAFSLRQDTYGGSRCASSLAGGSRGPQSRSKQAPSRGWQWESVCKDSVRGHQEAELLGYPRWCDPCAEKVIRTRGYRAQRKYVMHYGICSHKGEENNGVHRSSLCRLQNEIDLMFHSIIWFRITLHRLLLLSPSDHQFYKLLVKTYILKWRKNSNREW